MSVTGILIAAGIVAAVGIFVGVFLGIAGMAFRVEVDEREERVLAALPGNNCGGCGYPGCSGLAAAIAKGEAPVNACPVGGEPVARKVAEVMGVDAGESVRRAAFVRCGGDCERAGTDYAYTGAEDCRMAMFVPGGGPKSCGSGCLGYGSCVRSCPFDAIHIEKGIAVVDREACKACGKCVAACPKGLIALIPYDARYAVACRSTDKGPVTMKVCTAGCIGCGICARTCPVSAVTVADNHATIDPGKCISCGACAAKCPKKCILRLGAEPGGKLEAPAKAAEPGKSAEQAKTAKPAKTAEPAKASELAKSVEPANLTEQAKSPEQTKTAESAKPTEQANSPEQTSSAGSKEG